VPYKGASFSYNVNYMTYMIKQH